MPTSHLDTSEPTLTGVCTVVTQSHVPYARCLFKSVNHFHPRLKLFAVVIDPTGHLSEIEGVTTIPVESLGIPNLDDFLFQYTAFEACNALKSFLIRHLRRNLGLSSILYLDSDLVLYRPIDSILSASRSCSVLLTPHIISDPQDEYSATMSDIFLSYGVFNAGVIGIGELPDSEKFINWWCSKMLTGCIDDRKSFRYVDQKYLDLVPAIFNNVYIYKDDCFNVGYYNINNRSFQRLGDAWTIGGKKLISFHFTQFDPTCSKYKSGMEDAKVDSLGQFRDFLNTYAESLVRFGFSNKSQYAFNHHASGLEITKNLRRYHLAQVKAGTAIADPFHCSRYERMLRKEFLETRFRRILQKFLSPWRFLRQLIELAGYRWVR